MASPTTVGRYTLYDAIGEGGMASVHLGRLRGDASFARIVAIKRLKPIFAGDPAFVAMFLDETRLAARIKHPNVVPILDVVSTASELFMVMDYVAGESLASLFARAAERREPIPIPVCVAIVCDMLHGLHAAHEATDAEGAPLGLVHRDVSPQNVLVGADGLTRLLDFGIAKARGRSHTTGEGQRKGKLRYMAPEQITDAPLSRAADLHAAAVVFWELLAARRLHVAESEAGVIARILLGELPPPSDGAREAGVRSAADLELVGRLDPVVAKGLAQEPAARFSTAREMASAIEQLVARAPLFEVAAWIERLAGSTLRARAETVTRLERGDEDVALAQSDEPTHVRAPAAEEPRPDATPSPLSRPSSRARPVVALVAALTGVALAASLVAVRAWRGEPAAPALASLPRSDEVLAPAPSGAPATATATPPIPSAHASASASSGPPASASSSAPPRPRATQRKIDPCKPPFTWDAQGVKHFKPECM